jgi:3-dehydroquinate synthase
MKPARAARRAPATNRANAEPASTSATPSDGGENLVLHVRADDACAIEVRRGLVRSIPEQLAAAFPRSRFVVITDENVADLHAQPLLAEMRGRGLSVELVAMKPGEPSKSFARWIELVEEIYRLGLDRRGVIVNVGGGLVCDVGGTVAATYLRGVDYVNVPTTLLAQHDAAIGGKVAVNAPWAKNFLGAFHQPKRVFVDPELLQTLDRRQMAAGVAEAIKVAILGERTLFELLEREPQRILGGRDPVLLEEVVARAARRKIELLRDDPLEADLRRPLNLGHTFGHALETELGYEGLLHGEAVAFGIAVATTIARRRGVCAEEDAERILALLDAYRLPPAVPRARLAAATKRLAPIRLVRGGRLNYVLPTAIDAVTIKEVAERELGEALAQLAAHPRLGRAIGSDGDGG